MIQRVKSCFAMGSRYVMSVVKIMQTLKVLRPISLTSRGVTTLLKDFHKWSICAATQPGSGFVSGRGISNNDSAILTLVRYSSDLSMVTQNTSTSLSGRARNSSGSPRESMMVIVFFVTMIR